jgi:anti-sigma regulatory factor (Ser/Thr protein kinase)
MSRNTAWSHEIFLACLPANASRARAFVVTHLAEHDLQHLTDDVRLVVSELASNAILHTTSEQLSVALAGDADTVRVSVGDSSPRFVAVPATPRSVMSLGGRGLLLTAGLCSEWGVEDGDGEGKRVWASFDVDALA